MRGSPPHTAGEGGSLPWLPGSLAKASLSQGQVPPHAPPLGPPFWPAPHPMPLPLPCPALRPVHAPEAQGGASGLGTSPATPRGTSAGSLPRSQPLPSLPAPYASGVSKHPHLRLFHSLTSSPVRLCPEPPECLPRALSHGTAEFDTSAPVPRRVCLCSCTACLCPVPAATLSSTPRPGCCSERQSLEAPLAPGNAGCYPDEHVTTSSREKQVILPGSADNQQRAGAGPAWLASQSAN